MKKIGILIIFLCISTSLSSQEKKAQGETIVYKNSLYASGTVIPGLIVEGTLNYERQLKYWPGKFLNSFWFRIGTGYYTSWGDDGPVWTSTATLLTGKNKNHMELGLGFSAINRFELITPSGSLGYRYYKSDGQLLFRTGLGYPEILYVGIGLYF